MLMPEKFNTPERSAIMARVRSKGTGPEMRVRRALFARGLRYRLHTKGLPGSPDLVLKKYKSVIFVHGCFWHWHGCRRSRMPATNVDYWNAKIKRNQDRDYSNILDLLALGWRVLIVWECALIPSLVEKTADVIAKWLSESQQQARCDIISPDISATGNATPTLRPHQI